MGLLDELKKLTKPYDDDDDFFDDDGDDALSPPVLPSRAERADRSRTSERRSYSDDGRASERRSVSDGGTAFDTRGGSVRGDNRVMSIHTTTAVQVVISQPDRFEQAAEIADHLRERRTVVMNLETTPKDVSRRLVDFLSGVAYANDGKIKKVAVNTYIITPYSVDIMGDLIDELENNGVYI